MKLVNAALRLMYLCAGSGIGPLAVAAGTDICTCARELPWPKARVSFTTAWAGVL